MARLNQQVNSNQERFPEDFMFQLTKGEYESLMLQFATSKKGRGGRRKLPYVFTEHGAIVGQNARLDSALIDKSAQSKTILLRETMNERNVLRKIGVTYCL